MVIFTADKSTRIDSPRHLTLRHARRTVARKKRELGTLRVGEDIPDPSLKPGEEQLHSYWAPGLAAGPIFEVRVTQTLKVPGDTDLPLTGKQTLTVDAPQFTLPAGSVHSTYPPAGYSEDHRYLPHVILTDPHLPWERLATPRLPVTDLPPRNRVPWLALLAFEPDELRLDPTALDGADSIFSGTSETLKKPVTQMDTLAVNMMVGDALLVKKTASPFSVQKFADSISTSTKAERSNFIFLSPDTFHSLFSPFDDQGKRNIPKKPDTTPYQYMAHVRNINTTGMALAGVEDTVVFSIVVSPRCGTLDNSKTVPVVVHLVSIEGVGDMTFPLTQSHVALCSLYSWTYSVLPPGQLNVSDAFTEIGTTLGVLKPPLMITKQFGNATDPVATRIGERMNDGYSLVKYCTQTGEPTMAFFRGPLTPHVVKPIPQLNKCSNSGVDLQIMDQEMGIMDLSYSSAWQLGRALALANQPFCAAIGRLRSAIQKEALKNARIDVVNAIEASEFRTREQLFENLFETIRKLTQIQLADPGSIDVPFEPGGPLKRWHRRRLLNKEFPSLDFESPRISEHYQKCADAAARKLAQTDDGEIFDETNTPVSTDWMIVLAFVMNRMFLVDVPAYYLITDPCHLEKERLNFFYIDPNWVEAMVDGTLSLGNHMGTDKDRVAIKAALNDYIRSKPELQPHAPQIPTYGFFLRSDLVSRFPDLRVTTIPYPAVPPIRAPLLRHEIVVDGVMLGLFDQVPGSSTLAGLEFTQPPHQQRFAAADGVDVTEIDISIRRQYTVGSDIRDKDTERHKPLDPVKLNLPKMRTDPNQLFIWGSDQGLTNVRMLRLPRFPELQLKSLLDNMGEYTDPTNQQKTKYFDDETANSALFGMQLTDPTYRLVVNFSAAQTAVALTSLVQQNSSGSEDIRTLKMIEPSTVQKPHDPEPGEDSESDGSTLIADDDALAEKVSFDRPANHKPPAIATIVNLAPNVAQLPDPLPLAALEDSPADSTAPDDPAHLPKFHCKAYNPNEQGYVNVNSGDKIPQDIIFSVQITDTRNSPYQLEEFEIRAQLGEVDPKIRNCLMSEYKGIGATMLRNLRFNVLAMPLTVDRITYLSLRLLPRAERGYIEVTKIGQNTANGQELSFILGMATPNAYPNRTTLVNISTFSKYVKKERMQEDTFQVTLINKSFP